MCLNTCDVFLLVKRIFRNLIWIARVCRQTHSDCFEILATELKERHVSRTPAAQARTFGHVAADDSQVPKLHARSASISATAAASAPTASIGRCASQSRSYFGRLCTAAKRSLWTGAGCARLDLDRTAHKISG